MDAADSSLDALGSKCIGKLFGPATIVQWDTGSIAFSLPFYSSVRGSHSNSLHHLIHACAHSRLDNCGVGSGVGVGVGHVLVFLVSFLLVLSMMWMMPAWMVMSLM